MLVLRNVTNLVKAQCAFSGFPQLFSCLNRNYFSDEAVLEKQSNQLYAFLACRPVAGYIWVPLPLAQCTLVCSLIV